MTTLRQCRHLKAFDVEVKVNDPANSGMPPWMIACEDCAATIFESLEHQMTKISNQPSLSGKSSGAVSWARTRRLLGDLKGNQ